MVDKTYEKLDKIHKTLMENRFPFRFIDKNMKLEQQTRNIITVGKKAIFMNIDLKGVTAAKIFENRL